MLLIHVVLKKNASKIYLPEILNSSWKYEKITETIVETPGNISNRKFHSLFLNKTVFAWKL